MKNQKLAADAAMVSIQSSSSDGARLQADLEDLIDADVATTNQSLPVVLRSPSPAPLGDAPTSQPLQPTPMVPIQFGPPPAASLDAAKLTAVAEDLQAQQQMLALAMQKFQAEREAFERERASAALQQQHELQQTRIALEQQQAHLVQGVVHTREELLGAMGGMAEMIGAISQHAVAQPSTMDVDMQSYAVDPPPGFLSDVSQAPDVITVDAPIQPLSTATVYHSAPLSTLDVPAPYPISSAPIPTVDALVLPVASSNTAAFSNPVGGLFDLSTPVRSPSPNAADASAPPRTLEEEFFGTPGSKAASPVADQQFATFQANMLQMVQASEERHTAMHQQVLAMQDMMVKLAQTQAANTATFHSPESVRASPVAQPAVAHMIQHSTATFTVLAFPEMDFDAIDKAEVVEHIASELLRLGLASDDRSRLHIVLRRGSVLAEITGPTDVMQRLYALPLADIRVHDHQAQPAPPPPTPIAEASQAAFKIKEKDIFRVGGKLPMQPQLKNWQAALRSEGAACSGRGQEGWDLLRNVELSGTTFESLAHPEPKWRNVVAMLAAALTRILLGEIGRKVNLEIDKWAKKGVMVNGLQILWLIYRHYDLEEGLGAVYDIEDLMSLSLSGGERGLESFITSWDYTMSNMTDEPQENLLRYLFHRQVKDLKCIEAEMAAYNRASKGEREHSYQYIMGACRRYLDRTHRESNRQAQRRAAGAPGAQEVDAAAAPSAGNTPKKKRTPSKKQRSGSVTSAAPAPSDANLRGTCFKWRAGKCELGNACRYAHHEVTSPPRGSKGRGKGSDRRGNTPRRPSPDTRSPEEKKSILCRNFSNGICTRGDNCAYAHSSNPVSGASSAATATLVTAVAADLISPSAGQTIIVPTARRPPPRASHSSTTPSKSCLKSVREVLPRRTVHWANNLFTKFIIHLASFCSVPKVDWSSWQASVRQSPDYSHGVPYSPNEHGRLARLRAMNDAKECGTWHPLDWCRVHTDSPAAIATAPPSPIQSSIRSWIVDSGAGKALANRSDFTPEQLSHAYELPVPVRLRTANGVIAVTHAINLQVPHLGDVREVLLLENTPNVFSLGRLCIDQRKDFIWLGSKGQPPYLRDKARKTILAVDNYVPVFNDQDAITTELKRPAQRVLCCGSISGCGGVGPNFKERTPLRTRALGGFAGNQDPVGMCTGQVQSVSQQSSSPFDAAAQCTPCSPSAMEPSHETSFPRAIELPADPSSPSTAVLLKHKQQHPPTDEQSAADKLAGEHEETLGREERLRREAHSTHHLATHYPKNPFCATCRYSKPFKLQARRCDPESVEESLHFGHLLLGDHIILKREDSAGYQGEKAGMLVFDDATGYRDFHAMTTNSAELTTEAFRNFAGEEHITKAYTDCAPELRKACRDLGWLHPEATPHREESRGKIEREIRSLIEGARCGLYQSGFDHDRWPDAAQYHARACNFLRVDPVTKTTPHFRRFGEEFRGLIVPFGAKIRYRITDPDWTKKRKFENRMEDGFFAGWRFDLGCLWHGDYIVYRLRDLVDGRSHPRPDVVKEIEVIDGDFAFPLAEARDQANAEMLKQVELDKLQDEILPSKSIPTRSVSTQTSELPPAVEPGAVKAGYHMSAGRPTRNYKGSTRPPDMWPELWRMMSPKDRQRARDEYHKSLKDVEKALCSTLEVLCFGGVGPDSEDGTPLRTRASEGFAGNQDPLGRCYEQQTDATTSASPELPNVTVSGNAPLDALQSTDMTHVRNGLSSVAMSQSQALAAALSPKLFRKQRKQLRSTPLQPQEEQFYNVSPSLSDHSGWHELDAWVAAAIATDSSAEPDEQQQQLKEVLQQVRSQHYHADGSQLHRQKEMQTMPLWNALVTKTLHPGDPLCRSKEALDAVNAELKSLRKRPVWDEQHPIERSKAKRLYPDAHFARLFALIGIKNFESQTPADYRWKGRVVLGGHDIRTGNDEWAVFTEGGSVPSTMVAARAALAVSSVLRLRRHQTDCIQAYVQARLTGAKTFVSLPRAWWPDGWTDQFHDPVCELLYALYGHPKAGDMWHDKLDALLLARGCSKIEGWPSIYYKFVQRAQAEELILIVAYVDDLLLFGLDALDDLVKELRSVVDFEDLHAIDKYLGCHHDFTDHADVTTVTWSMSDYFQSAVDIFKDVTGIKKLTPVCTPFAPEIDKELFIENVSTPGKWAKHAPSFLMKLLYGARMAVPTLVLPVQRLATQVTKWSAEADRRFLRVYADVAYITDWHLTGSLGSKDLSSLRIAAYPDADLCGDIWSTSSTTGFWVELTADSGRSFPIAWGAKRQTSSSTHTCEAETVALATTLKQEVIPLQIFLSKVLRRPVEARLYEDNEATIKSVTKGYSPAMRYLPRTQRCSLGLLHDVCIADTAAADDEYGSIRNLRIDILEHKGDLFTKEFARPKFDDLVERIGFSRNP